jgi:hypothetical protein
LKRSCYSYSYSAPFSSAARMNLTPHVAVKR